MERNAEAIAIEMDELSKQIDETNFTFVAGRQEKMRILSARRDALNIEHTAELAKQMYVTMPVYGWICFHCGVRCYSVVEAKEHFGELPTAKPVCTKGQTQKFREEVRNTLVEALLDLPEIAPFNMDELERDAQGFTATDRQIIKDDPT